MAGRLAGDREVYNRFLSASRRPSDTSSVVSAIDSSAVDEDPLAPIIANPHVRNVINQAKDLRSIAQEQNAVDDEHARYQRQWREEILTYLVNHPDALLWKHFVNLDANGDFKENPSTIEDLCDGKQFWNSWQYQHAYPKLKKFLSARGPLGETRCEVHYADFHYTSHAVCLAEWLSTKEHELDVNGNMSVKRNLEKKLDHVTLWEKIRSRSRPRRRTLFFADETGTRHREFGRHVPCRAFRIIDLSAMAARLILASTPRIDLSYVTPFLERYLSFGNWGMTNLISRPGNDHKLKTYFLEYHFAFFYVPDTETTSKTNTEDFRNLLRNSSPFTAGSKEGARRIFEEKLSFLIVGHGGDVYTNIQLAEKYYVAVLEDDNQRIPSFFTGPRKEADLSQRMPLVVGRAKPCATFLAWVCKSLAHVDARWQSAIEAVEAEVQPSSDAIFFGEKNSMLTDDASFSRSRKYLWAIQVYTVFEQKLEETIAVWRDFELKSLPKLYDPQIWHREESIETITQAIFLLERKMKLIHKKRREISNLKDGLLGTSQVLDSRVSVLQNDNIRLLTYVNLLFLPLAFCTLPISHFVITLCAVTIFTALLVLNLKLLTELVERYTDICACWLRKHMQAHHHSGWVKTHWALEQDKEATTIPTQNRLRRSTNWMYVIFILEALFVALPARELCAAHGLWGLRTYRRKLLDEADQRRLSRQRRWSLFGPRGFQEEDERHHGDTAITVLLRLGWILLSFLRMLLLPVSLLLIAMELPVILLWLTWTTPVRPRPTIPQPSTGPPRQDDPSALDTALYLMGLRKTLFDPSLELNPEMKHLTFLWKKRAFAKAQSHPRKSSSWSRWKASAHLTRTNSIGRAQDDVHNHSPNGSRATPAVGNGTQAQEVPLVEVNGNQVQARTNIRATRTEYSPRHPRTDVPPLPEIRQYSPTFTGL